MLEGENLSIHQPISNLEISINLVYISIVLKLPTQYKVINPYDPLDKLDSVLLKNYKHRFRDFYLSFLLVMENFFWATKEKDEKEIFRIKKEKAILMKTLESVLSTLIESFRYKHEGKNKAINNNEVIKSIDSYFNKPGLYKEIMRRIAILDRILELSKLSSVEIYKTHKIACAWALVIKKNGRTQWEEIANLLEWFENYFKGTPYWLELKKEREYFNTNYLKKAFHNLKRNYSEEMEKIKDICFDWEKRYEVLKKNDLS